MSRSKKRKSKDQVDQTQRDLEKYKSTFERFIKSKKKAKKVRKQLKTNGGKAKVNKKTRKMLKKRMRGIFRELISWLKANKNQMVQHQSRCLSKLHQVRMSSICYTCSARAKLFFIKDELKLHETTCRSLISECSSSWTYLIQFLDKVNTVYKLVREMEEITGVRFTDAVAGSPARSILDWADKNNFRTHLSNCSGGTCSFDTAKLICDNFVSITTPIYLKSALPIVKNISADAKKSQDELKKETREQRLKIKILLQRLRKRRGRFGHRSKWSRQSFMGRAYNSRVSRYQNVFSSFKRHARVRRVRTHNPRHQSVYRPAFHAARRAAAPKRVQVYRPAYYSPPRAAAPRYNPVHRPAFYSRPTTIVRPAVVVRPQRRRGRKLLVGRRPAPAPAPAAPAPAAPSAPSVSTVSTAQSSTQATFNPLLCPGTTVCATDKVVVTASQCSSRGNLCASPSMLFVLGGI